MNINLSNSDLVNTKKIDDINVKDPFWLNDYKILFYSDRLADFFPTINMTLIEKLNAIFRLSIYLICIKNYKKY